MMKDLVRSSDVKSVAQLYPPNATPEFHTYLAGLGTGDLDEKHNFVLRRALTATDRRALSDRAQSLRPFMERASRTKIASVVTKMLLGFGGPTSTVEEAAAVASTYEAMLDGLPVWCVERACIRFGRGEVRAEELGRKTLDTSFRPSSADLHKVARALLKPWHEEFTKIGMTLRGTTAPPELTAEQRAKIGDGLQATADMLRANEEAEHQLLVDRMAERTAKRNPVEVENSYRSRGLEPPRWKPGQQPVSLPLLLSLGWTVEKGRLLSPARAKADA